MGEKKERLFTFWSGGWVLVLALIVSIVVTVQVIRILGLHRAVTFGDGEDIETYRFALTPSLLEEGAIVSSGMPRNGVRAMSDPDFYTALELQTHPSRKMRRLLVSADRVVGVVIDGVARAYPLHLLNWHEIINDQIGETPFAVTYHPLCDSVAVFDRRVGGETAEFRVSGLLYNSNLLLFPHRETPGGESLYSQLLAKAVTGPDAEAGNVLTLLPSEVVAWGDWLKAHPDTVVLGPDPVFRKHYSRRPYGSYRGKQMLRYPVSPYPPKGEYEAWSRVLVVFEPGAAPQVIHDYDGTPPRTGEAGVMHAFWWAWASTHSD
jgi:Protein of unknown function (DUF3179)